MRRLIIHNHLTCDAKFRFERSPRGSPLPEVLAYRDGVYIGKIEKDHQGFWRLVNSDGRTLYHYGNYQEAYIELKMLGERSQHDAKPRESKFLKSVGTYKCHRCGKR